MSQPLINPSQRQFGNEEHQFKKLVDAYAGVLKSIGVQCRPYNDPTLPLFSKAKPETKLSSIAFLENALAVFEETRAAGGDFMDNRSLMWRMISRLKLIPDSEVFDKMTNDDVIEIYGLPDHCHLAWNTHLMDRVSFTVEQLLCQPWWELSTRPIEVLTEFQRLAAALVSEEHTKTFVPAVPRHLVQENNSHELLTLEMDVKYVSPLRQEGRNAAFMVIVSSRVLGNQKK